MRIIARYAHELQSTAYRPNPVHVVNRMDTHRHPGLLGLDIADEWPSIRGPIPDVPQVI
jgi:hypothetical protein